METNQIKRWKMSFYYRSDGEADIPLEATVAFGDNYNDIEMLEMVPQPFLMGNTPEELQKRFLNITTSNDEDGIYKVLIRAGFIFD